PRDASSGGPGRGPLRGRARRRAPARRAGGTDLRPPDARALPQRGTGRTDGGSRSSPPGYAYALPNPARSTRGTSPPLSVGSRERTPRRRESEAFLQSLSQDVGPPGWTDRRS